MRVPCRACGRHVLCDRAGAVGTVLAGALRVLLSLPQKHIKEHHEEVRERPCPHPGCNKVFMIDRYLQRHVKLIHTGACPVLPRTCLHSPPGWPVGAGCP